MTGVYLDGDVVFPEVPHLDELVDAVHREVTFDLCTQLGSGRNADGVGTDYLQI